MIDVSKEIKYQTARSGGKGGQHVNKVETMVEGYLHISNASVFTEEQKLLIHEKLRNRINNEGFLVVKSQVHRSQLANKQEVVTRIKQLITDALKKQKKRIATRPGKQARERRIEEKKKAADIKQGRKKIRYTGS